MDELSVKVNNTSVAAWFWVAMIYEDGASVAEQLWRMKWRPAKPIND